MQLLVALGEKKEGLLQPRAAIKSDKEEMQSSSPQPQEEGGDELEEVGVVAAAVAAAAAAAAVAPVAAIEEEKEGDEEEKAERRRSLRGMYGQAMELLVLKVMLALGEGEAALERVRRDKHLEDRVRQVSLLLEEEGACVYISEFESLSVKNSSSFSSFCGLISLLFLLPFHKHRPSLMLARPR